MKAGAGAKLKTEMARLSKANPERTSMRAGQPGRSQPIRQAVRALMSRMLGPAIQHDGPEANPQTARASGRTVVGAIATDGEVVECRGRCLPGHPGRQIALFKQNRSG